MKPTVCVVTIAPVAAVAAEEIDVRGIWSDPGPVLGSIRSGIGGFDGSRDADRALADKLRTLAYAMNQEIMAAASPDWATPSGNRRAVIRRWAAALASETPMLLKLALSAETAGTASALDALAVLAYAPSTAKFAEQVRPYFNHPGSQGFAAADLLFEHRLLTEEDKQMLRKRRPASESDLLEWAVGISAFGMVDGLDVARRMLATTPQGETGESLISHYGNPLMIARNLGPDAAELLPLMEALIEDHRVRASGYLKHFEYARDVVSGRIERPARIARNASGPLSPWLASVGAMSPAAGSSPASEPKTVINSVEGKLDRSPPPAGDSAAHKLWPMVAAAIAALVLVVPLLMKRRL
jgi:hypothetical protein